MIKSRRYLESRNLPRPSSESGMDFTQFKLAFSFANFQWSPRNVGTVLGWFTACLVLQTPSHAAEQFTAGWSETVMLRPGNIESSAKLDTGARTSSIHAPDVSIYENKGIKRAKFYFTGSDGTNVIIDRPIVRIAHIKNLSGPTLERPVINLSVCLANANHEVEFTLADRKGFNYPVLLGRRFLRKAGIAVNSLKRNIHRPQCGEAGQP